MVTLGIQGCKGRPGLTRAKLKRRIPGQISKFGDNSAETGQNQGNGDTKEGTRTEVSDSRTTGAARAGNPSRYRFASQGKMVELQSFHFPRKSTYTYQRVEPS
jgi:hypothetical protein